MNTKSVLIAALIAAATSSAFAAEYTAAAGNPSVQVTAPAVQAAPARAVTLAATDSYKDTAPVPTTSKADARPRAEVRALDKNWIASRINRDATEGAAQYLKYSAATGNV